jgi:hypothetical protein
MALLLALMRQLTRAPREVGWLASGFPGVVGEIFFFSPFQSPTRNF